ncbi:sterile alpha motif domain-containing protein 9 [Danio aesculapii]|uniref:sterile alpha motif domain-containing protein 9 n=1 Tax=Danio aesculapii TaxID=1142201 RepID=UPI0024C02BC2|nr:sterile alpha motif domain-containing protein 9 [Danio aesculapii]
MEGQTIPSFKGGTIHISPEVIESLSLLDIVWSNKFENENIDADDAKQKEADFLKGAPPQWLHFYWSEKEDRHFVKRNGYNNLVELINKNKRKIWSVIDMHLVYQPGSGGSTLAMQVLWKFHKEFRCARVTNSSLDVAELSKQVVKFFMVGDDQDQNTVLLLLDIKEKMNEDQPFKRILQDSLIKEINGQNIKANIPVVIILNCSIMDFTRTDTLSLEANLTEDEEIKLREKHNQVTTKHKEHERFRGFNRMLGNFSLLHDRSVQKRIETFTHSPECCMISTPNGAQIPVKYSAFSTCSLEIIWANMYQDVPLDHLCAEELESEFLKGGQPQWGDFYSSEHQGTLFVKRDLYKSLIQQINVQRRGQWNVTTINLFHHPKSGGSTLAMQVLWDLRKHLRCAKLKSKTTDAMIIKDDIIRLAKEGGVKHQNTVLLLLDVGDGGNRIAYRLQKELDKRIAGDNFPMLIILNVASKTTIPKSTSVKLKMELLPDEMIMFKEHKPVIREAHGTDSESFHSYNIMYGNFKKDLVKKVIGKDLENYVKHNKASPNTKLFSFLALLNSYIPGSYLPERLCLEFFASQGSHAGDTIKHMMTPFMDLLVIYSAEHCEDKCVRIAHPMIADACIHKLFTLSIQRGEITHNFLYFIVKALKKQADFLHICKDILITRQKGDQEHDKFSKLILDIMEEDLYTNSANCVSVLDFASNLYHKDAFYPQALARFYYIKFADYTRAERFAEKAIQRDPNNSFMRDTLGQVFKNRLRKTVKDKMSPNYSRRVLENAVSAVKAFKEETKTAEEEQKSDVRDSNAPSTFNIRGIFGFIQVLKILFDALTHHSSQWAEFLRGKTSITSLGTSFRDQKLKRYNDFLSTLKEEIKEKFHVFQYYLTYSKPSIDREEPPYFYRDVEDCFKKYVIQQEKAAQSKLRMLEIKKADTFPGLLNLLDQDTSVTELEEILSLINVNDSQIYILANIILCNKSPTSQSLVPKRELQYMMWRDWQQERKRRSPEFYLLVLLLFWPGDGQQSQSTPNSPNLAECVIYMHQAFERTYRLHLRSRYLVPLFFLGKGDHLQRVVHRSNVEQNQMDALTKGDEKAEIQELQRVQGEVKDHKVFALRGTVQVEVTPHHAASVRGQGLVSFYLGFNIRGPVAYNIRPSHRQCRTCASIRDSFEWDLIEPSVISNDAQIKYRINLGSGCYECRRTGLRVECLCDVQLEYFICDWENLSDIPEIENCTPCGPLMDIGIISGELNAVYLPHFLCLGGPPVKDDVRILHVEDSGVSFEKCKLTRFHAKLLDHTFSPKGLLMKSGRSVNYHCETLIYQTLKSHLTLHVYLIPSDKKMIEAVKENETESKAILKPGPECSLQMKTWFLMRTLEKMRKSACHSEVLPEQLQLKYKPIKPNFFEVFVDAPKEDFYLQLMTQNQKGVVWDAKIRQADYSQSTSSVDTRRESYSSNDGSRDFPSSSGNRAVHEVLLECLDNLISDELKKFKWHLSNGVETFEKVTKSSLENLERCEVVTCLIDQYKESGAPKVTAIILRKMQKNNIANCLEEKLYARS